MERQAEIIIVIKKRILVPSIKIIINERDLITVPRQGRHVSEIIITGYGKANEMEDGHQPRIQLKIFFYLF